MSTDFVPPVLQQANAPIIEANAPDSIPSTGTTAEGTDAATAAEPVTPKTPREQLLDKISKLEVQIAKSTSTLAELKTKLENIDNFANLGVGSAVEIKIGRAETTRNVIGRVVAAEGERYKVYHGEGMDADVTVVSLAQVIRVIPETA